jgi:hypothetical protein
MGLMMKPCQQWRGVLLCKLVNVYTPRDTWLPADLIPAKTFHSIAEL